MLRKIKLYGQLAKFVGHKVIEADLDSAAEAVRMLIANFPELEQHMADQHYKVMVGPGSLTLDELHYPAGRQEIKIIPVVAGAGGNLTSILVGAALIGLSFVSFGGTAFAGAGGGFGIFGAGATGAAVGSTALFAIGAGLFLTGIAGLISPTPEIPQGPDTDQDPRKSFSFSGVQNTSRGGTPVPIVYGKTLTGSVVISAGIDTVQVKA